MTSPNCEIFLPGYGPWLVVRSGSPSGGYALYVGVEYCQSFRSRSNAVAAALFHARFVWQALRAASHVSHVSYPSVPVPALRSSAVRSEGGPPSP